MRLAALSVDLDEVPCYTAIHGLPGRQTVERHAVYRKCVPRFESLFDELGISATFFVIGRDLADERAADAVQRLQRAGHELGNHSFDHFYDLTRRGPSVIRAQVADGLQAIERVTGVAPVGFRAPGYTITDPVFDVLQELGVRYDSSVFPCPAYYTAKAATIASYKLRKRPTQSIVDDLRVLGAPAEPYRVGRPYSEHGQGLLELPIGVTSDWTARLPYIGTSLIMAGARGAVGLTRLIAGRNLVNLELHGIDLADAEQDGLEGLAPHQPDLRKPVGDKLATFRATIDALRDHGYEFVTLAQAARVFSSIQRQDH
jgi:peptidoglycan/xylan/chitin deacetylase (PgdA/CDA1 family)